MAPRYASHRGLRLSYRAEAFTARVDDGIIRLSLANHHISSTGLQEKMPAHPDVAKVTATATGAALKTVEAHAAPEALIFFSGWFCPFVQRAWIALEEKKVRYQYEEINPYDKSERFLSMNPLGLVPTLTISSKPVYESLVILEYLEDAYPEAPLRPGEPYEAAMVRLAIDEVAKKVVPAFYKLLQHADGDPKEARDAYIQAITTFTRRWFAPSGPWARGSEFTVLDAALAPWAVRFWLLEKHRGLELDALAPLYGRWHEHVLKRPSVVATTSDSSAYEHAYARYLSNESQSEVAKATRGGQSLP